MHAQAHPIHVEIWSDIACPWCYVGKRRFEAALERFEHAGSVRVTWRSFELDPAAPAERPGDRAVHLAAKYGTSVEEAHRMHDRMTEAGAAEGIEFRFDLARDGNTFDAHHLLQLAAAHGLQDAMEERLMRAHFTEGVRLADHLELARLGTEVGLPAEAIRDMLATDRYGAEVRGDERTAASLGIRAVPFFVVDRALGVSGAQAPDLLLELLRRGWEERTPATVADGVDACGPGGC